MRTLVATAVLLTGCAHKVALFCDENTPCTDPARPFCDLEGEFPASDGISKTCIPDPFPDAGPDATGPRVIDIAAGEFHTCAVIDDGSVRCWGGNAAGQLGQGNTISIGDDEPASAATRLVFPSRVKQIAAGGRHTCAILETGSVICWGGGGLLGYGDTVSRGDTSLATELSAVGVGAPVSTIEMGEESTCAITTSDHVRCWGNGDLYRLGYGNSVSIGDDEPPSDAGDVPLPATALDVAAWAWHTCAVVAGGRVYCWGVDYDGALGVPEASQFKSPSGGVDLADEPAAKISVGEYHTCALMAEGDVRCWGSDYIGQLGYGVTGAKIGVVVTPGSVDPVALPEIAQLAAGAEHTCAVAVNGDVFCWGRGTDGRLGYGNVDPIGDDETPTQAGPVPVGEPVTRVATGRAHTCALLASGSVRCWGDGRAGQLGYGNLKSIGDDEPPESAGDVPIF